MSLHILVVDDDKFTRMKVKSLLEGQGFRVDATDDLAEITRVVANDAVDVILMDVEMPNLSGDRLARVILSRIEHPPRIFLHSALEPTLLEAKARAIGAQGIIPKGLTGEQYADRIESAMAKRSGSADGGHLGLKETP